MYALYSAQPIVAESRMTLAIYGFAAAGVIFIALMLFAMLATPPRMEAAAAAASSIVVSEINQRLSDLEAKVKPTLEIVPSITFGTNERGSPYLLATITLWNRGAETCDDATVRFDSIRPSAATLRRSKNCRIFFEKVERLRLDPIKSYDEHHTIHANGNAKFNFVRAWPTQGPSYRLDFDGNSQFQEGLFHTTGTFEISIIAEGRNRQPCVSRFLFHIRNGKARLDPLPRVERARAALIASA